ncbi:hypothetical protein CNEO4_1010001 [Clostridium neonatale]|nr:hypothetical protein CNEO4_1010001 [Clostridium neonatale]
MWITTEIQYMIGSIVGKFQLKPAKKNQVFFSRFFIYFLHDK